MKKFAALIMAVGFMLMTVNPCLALTKLYYLQNADKKYVTTSVENAIREKDYRIVKQNPYYVTNTRNPEDYAIIILQPSGKNLYYYYESNNTSKKLNKQILKNIKSSNITYTESEDTTEIYNFSQTAKRTISGEKKTYNFEEVKPSTSTSAVSNTQSSSSNSLKGYAGKAGKGDVLQVYLQNAVNTATASEGDAVRGVLKADWKTSSGYVIAPAGSLLTGTITKSHSAQRGMRNGFVRIMFTKLMTPDGKTYDITSRNIDFNISNEGIVESTVSKVAVGALVGGLAGAAFGLMSGSGENVWKGALIGAGVGGGSQAIYSGFEKGIDAEIPAYTDVDVEITKDVSVIINY